MTEVEKPGIVGNDSIFEGTRGRVGGTVFRLVNGITIASRKPRSPRTQSVKQRGGRDRFRLATQYAREELAEPIRRAFFQTMFLANPKKLRNAYTAAITYYLNEVHLKVKRVVVDQKSKEDSRNLKKIVTVEGRSQIGRRHLIRMEPKARLKFRPPVRRCYVANTPWLHARQSFIGKDCLGAGVDYIESG